MSLLELKEKEKQAAMALEYIRRQDQGFSPEIKGLLFTNNPLRRD
jgi:hypothetical protein